MPVGQQDDREGACGDSLRHPTQTEEDEQAVEATDEGGKYTTMGDVWMEIDEGARPTKANKAEIAAAAKRRWKQVGEERKLMEQREQSRTCSSYVES